MATYNKLHTVHWKHKVVFSHRLSLAYNHFPTVIEVEHLLYTLQES